MTTYSTITSLELETRAGTAMPELEGIFSGLLAEVMHLDRVSVDSNFFNDLGADSLVMAHFCARVRKRGGLPPISIRDVYDHPTIRSLAAAVTIAEPEHAKQPRAAVIGPPTPTNNVEYFVCGALQTLSFMLYSYIALLAIVAGYEWVSAGTSVILIYVRLVAASSAVLVVTFVVPIAAKWILVGRWKPQQIRLWSFAYFRFWVVKTLIQSSPVARFFVGTPLYALYLRALGARIGPRVVIFSRRMPVCTDLLTIGAGTVIRKEVLFNCYRAQSGRIETGSVSLGRDVFVGERSVLDINTSMDNGGQLGHASALQSDQSVPKGEHWHGSPAQRTDLDYVRVPPARCGILRRAGYSIAAVLLVILFYLPLVEGFATLAIDTAHSFAVVLSQEAGIGMVGEILFETVILSLGVFLCLLIAGLFLTVACSRLLNLFIKPNTLYPLYGFRDAVHRAVARIGRIRFFTFLFGDSVFIVNFLQWLGYHLKPVEQTGSNFGSEVMHANPSLSAVGTGTMVADGLTLVNDDVSSTSFRISRTAVGTRNFVGNDVIYPAGGRTGHNVLLGTKVLVPLDGPVREGTGLLGSPCFEIPRSVERDSRFDHLRSGETLRRGLAAKTRYNIRTVVVFLFTRWLSIFVFALPYLTAIELYDVLPRLLSAMFFAMSFVATAVYLTLVHRLVEAFHPLQPTTCSIYHKDFWVSERLWKVHPIHYLNAFNGTPFKNVLWRLMGAKIGKRVFDDGAHISEPSLTAVGDESILNHRSKIQCHSQEDGTFKCDRTTLGERCTIGVGTFLLYGITMEKGSTLLADSFLMKGEYVPPYTLWGGNPAKEYAI